MKNLSIKKSGLALCLALLMSWSFSASAAEPSEFTISLNGVLALGETVEMSFTTDETVQPVFTQNSTDIVYIYEVIGDVTLNGFHPGIDLFYDDILLTITLTPNDAYLSFLNGWGIPNIIQLTYADVIFQDYSLSELCLAMGESASGASFNTDHGSGFITKKVFSTLDAQCDMEDCAPCDGKVTELTLRYDGAYPAVVTASGKKLGTIAELVVQPNQSFTLLGTDKKGTLGPMLNLSVDGRENTSIHTSCSIPIGPGLVFGDFTVVRGYSRNGGLLCPLENEPEPESEDCDCEGKVSELTLRYQGDAPAYVQVNPKKGAAIFAEELLPNEVFTILGTDKHGTLGTQIKLYIEGHLDASVHTSCSVPIGPGMTFGNFFVEDGYSLKGGRLCEQ